MQGHILDHSIRVKIQIGVFALLSMFLFSNVYQITQKMMAKNEMSNLASSL